MTIDTPMIENSLRTRAGCGREGSQSFRSRSFLIKFRLEGAGKVTGTGRLAVFLARRNPPHDSDRQSTLRVDNEVH